MISRFVQRLRNHWPVLVILPLAVIAITWPTFPRIFDADEFWLHVAMNDKWLRIWDAWHIGQVLAGQAELYYTDGIFYPAGTTLRFYSFVYPSALLLIALKAVMAVDDAYNLLFLLILCFNGFCGYALIQHLIKDKWISVFGAAVFAVATPFPYGQTVPDLITIGTVPLTVYFFSRSVVERRQRFAGLAGVCAGVTAFIGVYVYAFILLSVGILAAFKALSLWKRPAFWRALLLFIFVSGAIGALRFYPMLVNREDLRLGLQTYEDKSRSNDFLEHFALTSNPLTGPVFRLALNATPDYEYEGIRPEYKEAYLGYINLFLIAWAIFRAPRRRRLLPWIAILLVFAIMRLGHYFTFNDIEFTAVLLPKRFLTEWFPSIFGNIGFPEYYQIGVVMPLAVLACYGLGALVQSKPVKARTLVVIICILIVCIEFYTPRLGQTIDRQATAFVAWLRSEPEDQIKLVHLPFSDGPTSYYFYMQALTGYPHANGISSRLKHSVRRYIFGNLLLRTWDYSRSVHCLKHNEQSFTAALEQLLEDGFTHIVVHNWLFGDQFIMQTFENIPAAYDDGFVSVYRLRDLRLSCDANRIEPPRFGRLAASSLAAPGPRSAILSFHTSQAIEPERFDYLASLFSDWESLLHLYFEDGELVLQNNGGRYADIEALQNDSQVIYFTYNNRDSQTTLDDLFAFQRFHLCQRETHDDGAVIEHYVSREFSCELVTSADRFKVQYDNGARLENIEIQTNQDVLDLQFMWSSLPDETHSVSIQLFDAAGAKVLGQDSVIGHATLGRQRIDISGLAPGEYAVKLILYNFESGANVSGTEITNGTRFDRALEVAAIHQS